MCIWKVNEEDRKCEFCTFSGNCESRTRALTKEEKAYKLLDIMNAVIGIDIRKMSRKTNVVWGRNFLSYKLSCDGMSLANIGKVIDRDHATVLHGKRKAESALKCPVFYEDVVKIWNQFEEKLSLEKL